MARNRIPTEIQSLYTGEDRPSGTKRNSCSYLIIIYRGMQTLQKQKTAIFSTHMPMSGRFQPQSLIYDMCNSISLLNGPPLGFYYIISFRLKESLTKILYVFIILFYFVCKSYRPVIVTCLVTLEKCIFTREPRPLKHF